MDSSYTPQPSKTTKQRAVRYLTPFRYMLVYTHTYTQPMLTENSRVQELCECRGGRPDSPYGLCGLKVTLSERTNRNGLP